MLIRKLIDCNNTLPAECKQIYPFMAKELFRGAERPSPASVGIRYIFQARSSRALKAPKGVHLGGYCILSGRHIVGQPKMIFQVGKTAKYGITRRSRAK
jgi:hypothetical protein